MTLSRGWVAALLVCLILIVAIGAVIIDAVNTFLATRKKGGKR